MRLTKVKQLTPLQAKRPKFLKQNSNNAFAACKCVTFRAPWPKNTLGLCIRRCHFSSSPALALLNKTAESKKV